MCLQRHDAESIHPLGPAPKLNRAVAQRRELDCTDILLDENVRGVELTADEHAKLAVGAGGAGPEALRDPAG